MVTSPQPIYVCGATASGKSALALELAREFDGEIINADAFQMVRGLEILSAAPSDAERGHVAHHLFGVVGLDEINDAQAFAERAREKITELQGRGKTPIVVGGSGLYLKFLTHGASPLPVGNAAWRAEWDGKATDLLFAELQKIDPEEAARVGRENHRYVSRALEICQLSGQKASELRKNWAHVAAAQEANLRGIWLQWRRDVLQARIAQRTREMFRHGLVEEVAALEGKNLSITCDKAIGLREVQALLRGEISREECEELVVIATRQYAKRQETWFRKESWLTAQTMPANEAVWRRFS